MITEDYVSYNTAKLLKEKGFNPLECGMYYSITTGKRTTELLTSLIACPTLQMAMKWLREREWFICVIPLTFNCWSKVCKFGYNIWASDNLEIDELNTPEFNTYEEACEAGIRYCLENLI